MQLILPILSFAIATIFVSQIFANAAATVSSRTACEAGLDRLIKSSGMGESRLRLGSRVSATTFSRASLEALPPSAFRPPPPKQSVLSEAQRLLTLEKRAFSKITGSVYGNLVQISQDFDSIRPMNNADVALSVFNQLRARRIAGFREWQSGFNKAQGASANLHSYLKRNNLAIIEIDGKESIVQSADPGGPSIEDHRKIHAAQLLKIFAARLSKANPAIDFDQVELVRDDTKHTHGLIADRAQDIHFMARETENWLQSELSAIERLAGLEGTPGKTQLETKVREVSAEFERIKKQTGGQEAADRLESERNARPVLVLKKNGQTVAVLDRHSYIDPEFVVSDLRQMKERGFRCNGANISGAWEDEVGFRSGITDCDLDKNRTFRDRCKKAFDMSYEQTSEWPDPDRSSSTRQGDARPSGAVAR